ncbi:peptide-methionine (S)-S-oxide reductase MsrA [Chroococcus sp. FPU101]|uniref:peptide-methionine (S)-S-oxide reductase MsrA n=1 Tax=Chroococcus sp. FPU101 TaxID=1974212 RepID=UPI001A9089DB|nr:peptide-methionine (S)-S-oxide reductase MsrA [Chroococcus sp. FPU101]GFE68729.1 peptide methionine sulfoxide reductase [Chroococcus sp. FPU101]
MSVRFLLHSLFIISVSFVTFSCNVSHASFPDPVTNISTSTHGNQTAVLAGGCFWGMEAVFEHLKGVSEVISGFSGGNAETANYYRVSSGQTEHAESVKITYDPSVISYEQILKIYFSVAHDPTQLNRQGPDSGTQYRSAIFYATEEQRQAAQAYIDQLNKADTFGKPIATQLVPLKDFYAAEDYHQNFIDRNPNYPYVVVHDLPKLVQLQKQYPNLYKQNSGS